MLTKPAWEINRVLFQEFFFAQSLANFQVKTGRQKKFGGWIDSAIRAIRYKQNLDNSIWQITDDSPNLPNFPAAKHSRYTVPIINQ